METSSSSGPSNSSLETRRTSRKKHDAFTANHAEHAPSGSRSFLFVVLGAFTDCDLNLIRQDVARSRCRIDVGMNAIVESGMRIVRRWDLAYCDLICSFTVKAQRYRVELFIDEHCTRAMLAFEFGRIH